MTAEPRMVKKDDDFVYAAAEVFSIVSPYISHTEASSVFSEISAALRRAQEGSAEVVALLQASEKAQERERQLRMQEANSHLGRLRELQRLMRARAQREMANAAKRKTLKRRLGEERSKLTQLEKRLEESEVKRRCLRKEFQEEKSTLSVWWRSTMEEAVKEAKEAGQTEANAKVEATTLMRMRAMASEVSLLKRNIKALEVENATLLETLVSNPPSSSDGARDEVSRPKATVGSEARSIFTPQRLGVPHCSEAMVSGATTVASSSTATGATRRCSSSARGAHRSGSPALESAAPGGESYVTSGRVDTYPASGRPRSATARCSTAEAPPTRGLHSRPGMTASSRKESGGNESAFHPPLPRRWEAFFNGPRDVRRAEADGIGNPSLFTGDRSSSGRGRPAVGRETLRGADDGCGINGGASATSTAWVSSRAPGARRTARRREVPEMAIGMAAVGDSGSRPTSAGGLRPPVEGYPLDGAVGSGAKLGRPNRDTDRDGDSCSASRRRGLGAFCHPNRTPARAPIHFDVPVIPAIMAGGSEGESVNGERCTHDDGDESACLPRGRTPPNPEHAAIAAPRNPCAGGGIYRDGGREGGNTHERASCTASMTVEPSDAEGRGHGLASTSSRVRQSFPLGRGSPAQSLEALMTKGEFYPSRTGGGSPRQGEGDGVALRAAATGVRKDSVRLRDHNDLSRAPWISAVPPRGAFEVAQRSSSNSSRSQEVMSVSMSEVPEKRRSLSAPGGAPFLEVKMPGATADKSLDELLREMALVSVPRGPGGDSAGGGGDDSGRLSGNIHAKGRHEGSFDVPVAV